jgi:hypothetical protein
MITGSVSRYIAEVIQEGPLRLKVEENGPFANLKNGDFIVNEFDSAIIQDEDGSKFDALLREAKNRGYPFRSGLKQLGVNDNRIHEILPADDQTSGT